jgi:hypothetical protein
MDRNPGSGRPRKLNGAARRRLAAIARKNPKFSTVQVTERFNTSADTKISSSTVYRTLTEMGYLKFVPRKVPFMTKRTKENRVMWARNHCDFNWEKVVFTDESTFEFYRTKIREWAKERPNKGVPKNGPKIMIWGGISARGKTPLKIIIGTVDRFKYQDILSECLFDTIEALYPDGWVLQQDGAPPHTACDTRRYLAMNKITVLQWPPYSPDLNPIENVWELMKRRVEMMSKRTLAEWKAAIYEVWEGLSHEYLNKLMRSMTSRLSACIAAEGAKIKY